MNATIDSRSDSEIYARNLLPLRHGYPLWRPKPQHPSPEYNITGVQVGDVGFITRDGEFEFLFNICLPKDHIFQHYGVPDNFEQFKEFVSIKEDPTMYGQMSCVASAQTEVRKLSVEGSSSSEVAYVASYPAFIP